MAINVKVGSFTKKTSTGSQSTAHGLGTTPAMLIMWSAKKTTAGSFGTEYAISFGFTDGATSRCIANTAQDADDTPSTAARARTSLICLIDAGVGITITGEATFTSWDATNFTLNWITADANAHIIHFMAISGVSAKVVEWAKNGTTGNQTVTGVGFASDVVLHLTNDAAAIPGEGSGMNFTFGAMDAYGNQWAVTNTGLTRDPSEVSRGQRTNRCLYDILTDETVYFEATYVSMNLDGFTVNFSTCTSTEPVISLCINGLKAYVGNFNKSTGGAPVSQAITGVPISTTKRGLFLASFQRTSTSSPQTEARLGLGASDGSTEGAVALQAQDAVGTSNTDGISKTDKVFVKVNNTTPAVDAEADFTSFDSEGFTINWTTNDAVAAQILYLLLADSSAGRVSGGGILG